MSLDCQKMISLANCFGDVAQLARALDWQSRGRRFESALLHQQTKGLSYYIVFYPFFIVPKSVANFLLFLP